MIAGSSHGKLHPPSHRRPRCIQDSDAVAS
jgi:hypothetical protein